MSRARDEKALLCGTGETVQPQHPPHAQPSYPQQPYPPPGAYAQGPYGRPPKKKMGCGVIAAIAAAVAIPVFGIMAAIAIPAFTKYMRRSKTAEARVQLAKAFDAMSSYHAEHGRCPGGPSGSAGVTPPLSVNCNDGPGGRCEPGGSGPAAYDTTSWEGSEVWSALDFAMLDGHYFHYDVEWTQDAEGTCQFVVRAFGDLDDDGVFSTFERSGAADVNGVDAAAGLYIDQEVE